jgi:hypothetical protein
MTDAFGDSVLGDIADRRAKQIAKGYDAAHDDEHTDGSIKRAAAAYLTGNVSRYWPWSADSFTPGDERDNLLDAATLIVAEIERMDRAMRKIAGDALRRHAFEDSGALNGECRLCGQRNSHRNHDPAPTA